MSKIDLLLSNNAVDATLIELGLGRVDECADRALALKDRLERAETRWDEAEEAAEILYFGRAMLFQTVGSPTVEEELDDSASAGRLRDCADALFRLAVFCGMAATKLEEPSARDEARELACSLIALEKDCCVASATFEELAKGAR